MEDEVCEVVILIEGVPQRLTYGGQLEIEEEAVGCAQITKDRRHGYAFVRLLRRIAIDYEVDNSKKGVAVNSLLAAYILHRLVAKTKTYAKSSKSLKHAVIVADEVYHLVIGLVEFHTFHNDTICIFTY